MRIVIRYTSACKAKMYYIGDNVIPQNIIITVVQFRNIKTIMDVCALKGRPMIN